MGVNRATEMAFKDSSVLFKFQPFLALGEHKLQDFNYFHE